MAAIWLSENQCRCRLAGRIWLSASRDKDSKSGGHVMRWGWGRPLTLLSEDTARTAKLTTLELRRSFACSTAYVHASWCVGYCPLTSFFFFRSFHVFLVSYSLESSLFISTWIPSETFVAAWQASPEDVRMSLFGSAAETWYIGYRSHCSVFPLVYIVQRCTELFVNNAPVCLSS